MKYRRAGAAVPAEAPAFTQRPLGKLLLLLLMVLLLSFAYAPFKQFYLAWIGLAPLLIVLRHCRSAWRAFLWSWLGGILLFSANMWWLGSVTGPGAIAVMPILGLYWAVAGAIIKGAGLLDVGVPAVVVRSNASEKQPAPSEANALSSGNPLVIILKLLGIAAVFVAFEWLRGSWPFGGFPWLFLGHTQTPVLIVCQFADLTGVAGVSFWVVLINGCVALLVMNRLRLQGLTPAVVFVLLLSAGSVAYGAWRFSQWPGATKVGPNVLVVQSNFPQSNSGQKGASPEEILATHERLTRRALDHHGDVDLVAWSETMMPPLNIEARHLLDVDILERAHRTIAGFARQYHAAFLVGGAYWADFRPRTGKGAAPGEVFPADTRNVAYYYDRQTGAQWDIHYDKIHLVPFGEYVPFKTTLPWLYHLLISFGPADMESYQLTRGDEKHLPAFPLPSTAGGVWRFVTPICFEDMDGPLVARMFRPAEGDRKRADFIVNITNDGWFNRLQLSQHFQASRFRAIENRAPIARSVNTGISGFIDSMGRPYDVIPPDQEGTSIGALRLDTRTTLYTRIGDAFAFTCAGVTALLALAGMTHWILRRKRAVR